jgi:hypothetical protein
MNLINEIKKEKKIKRMFTIRPTILKKFDLFCKKNKVSRSALIEKIIFDFLKRGSL